MKTVCCSHCGKSVGEIHPTTDEKIDRIIVNHEKTAYICSECVGLCVQILGRNRIAVEEAVQ